MKISKGARILPILFNGEMVRAILEDRKTVTRRLVNPQPLWIEQDKKYRTCPSGWWWGLDRIKAIEDSQLFAQMLAVECAPYRVGDILYVRETWCKDAGRYLYRANYSDNEKFYMNGQEVDIKWHPSIHMPRDAARIWLRVENMRAERLQDSFGKHGSTIFEIRSEGINIPEDCHECIDTYGSPCCIDTTEDDGSECGMLDDPRSDFANLWDSTLKPQQLKKFGWTANPWVWRVEFERCEKPEAAA